MPLDTNNIWQYTEGDTAPTFSGLLALLTGPLSTKIAALAGSIASATTAVAARLIAQTPGDRVLYGSSVISVNSAGQAEITFSTPFPSTVTTIVAALGDGIGSAYVTGFTGTDLTKFTTQVRLTSGAAATSGAYRINWIAVGR